MRRTAMDKAIIKATGALLDETMKQIKVIMGSCALVFHRYEHWGEVRIRRTMKAIMEVFSECGNNPDITMMKMLEDETGIEMQNGSGVSYHSLDFLNCKDLRRRPSDLYQDELLYMRKRQMAWVAPQCMAGALIALHRREHYGYDRLSRLMQRVDQIRTEYNYDVKVITELCKAETGFDLDAEVK